MPYVSVSNAVGSSHSATAKLTGLHNARYATRLKVRHEGACDTVPGITEAARTNFVSLIAGFVGEVKANVSKTLGFLAWNIGSPFATSVAQ